MELKVDFSIKNYFHYNVNLTSGWCTCTKRFVAVFFVSLQTHSSPIYIIIKLIN